MQSSASEGSLSQTNVPSGSAIFWTGLLAVALVLLQLELVFSKSINWDEFFHLSQIHSSNRGEYVQWLQTPHVFLFSWVPGVVENSIDQVIAIRLMLLPCAIVTALAIWATAKHFTDTVAAAVAAIAWFGAGYVFLHSFALRADMVAAMLLTLAICALVVMRRPAVALGTAGILIAIAFVATIKSVLYFPAIAAVLVWRFTILRSKPVLFGAILAFAMLAVIAIVLLPKQLTTDIVNLFKASATRMFSDGVFPSGGYLLAQMALAPAFTAMVAFAFSNYRKANNQVSWWLPMGLFLPLCWVIIYRNSYPYFYAFILPPVAILAAWGVPSLVKRYSLQGTLGIVLIGSLVMSVVEDRTMLEKQRLVHSGVTDIFGKPVEYIDDVAFLPNFPRAVPHFASGWALENYRANAHPMYRDTISVVPAPMLFRQGYALENLAPSADDELALLVEDAKALRENYIQHWGRVYVAGKALQPSAEPSEIVINIPGLYTLEKSPLTIAGRPYQAGETVVLKRGTVKVGPVPEAGATLRWGDNLAIPKTPFPQGKLFTNY